MNDLDISERQANSESSVNQILQAIKKEPIDTSYAHFVNSEWIKK